MSEHAVAICGIRRLLYLAETRASMQVTCGIILSLNALSCPSCRPGYNASLAASELEACNSCDDLYCDNMLRIIDEGMSDRMFRRSHENHLSCVHDAFLGRLYK